MYGGCPGVWVEIGREGWMRRWVVVHGLRYVELSNAKLLKSYTWGGTGWGGGAEVYL